MLLSEVERVLSRYGVSRRGGEVVLVACSGGLDSVVLAHACAELLGGRRVVLAHVDHQVRAGSEADARFVEQLGAKLGLDVRVTTLEPGRTSEARLRAARYQALEAARAGTGAKWILTAHTESDQAETVLLTLVRSARAQTLRGIPVRRGAILRPMLRVSKDEVRRYAASAQLSHREDPTNQEPMYLRNRIRKELLPLLERRYRSGMARRLARLARLARTMNRKKVPRKKVPGHVLRTNEIRKEVPGHVLTVVRKKVPGHVLEIALGAFPAIAMRRSPWQGGSLPDGRMAALFDADVLRQPALRPSKPGDRIIPFGMEGHRKLTDVMREAGIRPEARVLTTIVADEAGDVVWVPGLVRSNAAPVGPLTRWVWAFWIAEEGLADKEETMSGSAQLQDAASSVTLELGQGSSSTQEDE